MTFPTANTALKVGDIVYWRTLNCMRSEVIGGRILELRADEGRAPQSMVLVEIICRKFRDYAGFHETREVYAIEDELYGSFIDAYKKQDIKGLRCGRPWYLVDPTGVPCAPGV